LVSATLPLPLSSSVTEPVTGTVQGAQAMFTIDITDPLVM
jgi:hypothetical protein